MLELGSELKKVFEKNVRGKEGYDHVGENGNLTKLGQSKVAVLLWLSSVGVEFGSEGTEDVFFEVLEAKNVEEVLKIQRKYRRI